MPPKLEHYIGFYTTKPFWAVKSVALENATSQSKEFTAEMQTYAFEHQTEKYSMKVCRDGMFLFRLAALGGKMDAQHKAHHYIRMEEGIEQWRSYLTYVNAVVLLFESVFAKVQSADYFETREITNKDAFWVTLADGMWRGNALQQHSPSSYLFLARFPSTFSPNTPPDIDLRFTGRVVVKEEVFFALQEELDGLISNERIVSLIAELTKSVGEYKIANHNTSLVLSWFIIESFLDDRWEKWLDSVNKDFEGGLKRINSERRKTLLQGRGYTAATISNVLELNGQLDFDLFKKIEHLRGLRNGIVHRKPEVLCTAEDCEMAFNVIRGFLLQETRIDVRLNLSYSITMI